MAKSWKDALLASGLPLEHDVRAYLIRHDCIASFEYSYLRPDELRLERQFSYDIDASLVRPPHFVNFMVECKFRHPSVIWMFAPEVYGGPAELSANDFLHASDHFVERKFPFNTTFPRRLAPCCSKGVEVTPEGTNDKSIPQALSQLAFGFISQVADGIEHQVRHLLPGDFIYYNVPVIVTTARLHRLRDDVSIEMIRSATNVAEVSEAADLLVLSYTPGIELRNFNWAALQSLRVSLGEDALKATLRSFTDDLDHLWEVIAGSSPRAVVIVSIADGWAGFNRCLEYIDETLNPSSALIAEVKEQFAKIDRTLDDFKRTAAERALREGA